MKKIIFIGHVSKDINQVKNIIQIIPGGGVYYGSFVAKSFSWETIVLTKGNYNDKELFKDMEEYGIKVIWKSSENTTSIKNIILTDNPDDRFSKIMSRADPFNINDIRNLEGDIIHISPLWFGEFPDELIEEVRKKAKVIGLDAQGFLRHIDNNGNMIYKDWEEKRKYLPLVDVFKVDAREAEILTEEKDMKRALKIISHYGPNEILLTYRDGIMLFVENNIYEEKFGKWNLEGRTGRGDTALSSYIIHRHLGYEEALLKSALITTEKMQRTGPFKL
jgi:sugar/nucleoside kinase (ribokinase family)